MFRAFMLGMYEFRRSMTTSFVGQSDEYRKYLSYDKGRDFAHRCTFRIYEED